MDEIQSGRGFKLMSLSFKIRDLIKPRGNILKEVGIKPGFQVLDFGCGPGGYIRATAKLTGLSGKIYAMDVNPAAILTVKSLAARHKLANVHTILSNRDTGLPDASINVILLYDVLHHLKPLDAILAELHRVLKSGGILSVSDHHLEEKDVTSRISGGGLFRLLQKGKVFNFSRI